MQKQFLTVEDFPGGIGADIYRMTKHNGIILDVSIITKPEAVYAAEEPTEENPEPEKVLKGWNVDVGQVGCAVPATEEMALLQFGYAAKKLGIEVDKPKVITALYA